MRIKKLPQHLINKLKAWEIVERPASILKELVENSLDAWATRISIHIEKWGKKLIKVEDNGNGVAKEDLLLTIERYATSKIDEDQDLFDIGSYGFRGEALASISEVSVRRMQSKQTQELIWYELYRSENSYHIKEIPFAQPHGTIVYVEDVFHNIPAREKFLKTDATEWNYIKQVFLQYVMVHPDKKRDLYKDGKILFSFDPADSVMERILQVTKNDREKNLKEIAYKDDQLHLYGVAWDASLHFATGQYFWIFVNGRPVQDRLLKKSVMEAYKRQIVPGSYPFVCLFVDISPKIVDVNVHPRKSEVKFLDPWSMFTRVQETIRTAIGEQKVNYAAFRQKEVKPMGGYAWSNTWSYKNYHSSWAGMTDSQIQWLKEVWQMRKQDGIFSASDINPFYDGTLPEQKTTFIWWQENYTLLGQIWDSYIILSTPDSLVYIDQHALAERIAFERMKTKIAEEGFQSEVLLSPLKVEVPKDIDIASKLEILTSMGFDVSEIWPHKVVIYAIPQVFSDRKVDIELMLNWVWTASVGQEVLTPAHSQGERESSKRGEQIFELMLDEMVGMKACKASIKAGQKLSPEEMKKLVQDGFEHISGMFVCQHGRPSVVRIERENVDGLFERH